MSHTRRVDLSTVKPQYIMVGNPTLREIDNA